MRARCGGAAAVSLLVSVHRAEAASRRKAWAPQNVFSSGNTAARSHVAPRSMIGSSHAGFRHGDSDLGVLHRLTGASGRPHCLVMCRSCHPTHIFRLRVLWVAFLWTAAILASQDAVIPSAQPSVPAALQEAVFSTSRRPPARYRRTQVHIMFGNRCAATSPRAIALATVPGARLPASARAPSRRRKSGDIASVGLLTFARRPATM